MDFFSAQEKARQKTSLLVIYFLIAVILIVFATYLATIYVFSFTLCDDFRRTCSGTIFWDLKIFGIVSLSTLALIGFGSLYKTSQLASGGSSVAEMLGARRIYPNTTDLEEKKVLNVVEEMSIASGSPVPPVYLQESETSINAFAAGFTPKDAVIGVTKGTLQNLTREELQGVIAHEFSHILNGDMRTNIRLIGLLNGILVLGLTGYFLFRMALSSSSHSRSRWRRSDDKQGGLMLFAVLGAALMAIGYIGVFFGKLIKSAVSRQREFLADASAVQFTRNPHGIAGALKKIAGLVEGSHIDDPHAEEASHMFFGDAIHRNLSFLFATHPPLAERIQRLDPSFKAELLATEKEERQYARASSPQGAHLSLQDYEPSAPRIAVNSAALTTSIGSPQLEHQAYANTLLHQIPAEILERIHDPYGARAIVFALLLDNDKEIQNTQLNALSKTSDEYLIKELFRVYPIVHRMGATYRLILLDLSLPALKALSLTQRREFLSQVKLLIEADRRIRLFEYVLQVVLSRHLPISGKPLPSDARFSSVKQIQPFCEMLFSTLSRIGHENELGADAAFKTGTAILDATIEFSIIPRDKITFKALDRALQELYRCLPALKKKIIEAALSTIYKDGQVTLEEFELIRAIGDALDCPIPPLLPGQL